MEPHRKEATHISVLTWETPWTEGAWWATVHGVAELDRTQPLTLTLS